MGPTQWKSVRNGFGWNFESSRHPQDVYHSICAKGASWCGEVSLEVVWLYVCVVYVCVFSCGIEMRPVLIDTLGGSAIRDVDYNSNKPMTLITCGDDRKVKLWDLRTLKSPVSTLEGHSHWVWKAKYNPFHDQLIVR